MPLVDTNIAKESTQLEKKADLDTLVYLIAALLEKMPRVDNSDRVIAAFEAAQPVSLASLATVTTVGAVTSVTNPVAVRDFTGGNAAAIPYAQSIPQHIYNNIVVS